MKKILITVMIITLLVSCGKEEVIKSNGADAAKSIEAGGTIGNGEGSINSSINGEGQEDEEKL